MDNPEGTVKDPTSATKATPGAASAENQKESSQEKPGQKATTEEEKITLTKTERDNLISDRLAPLGRKLKAAEEKVKELETSLAERATAETAKAKAKLDADEEAELNDAGDDKEKRERVKTKYADLRRGQDLQVENKQLKEQVASFTRVHELLERLNVENVDELEKLLDNANKVGQANV